MVEVEYSGPEDEQELRAKILAGSQDVDDYRALANILLNAGKEEEAVTVSRQALDLPLREVEKGEIYAELAWLLYELGRDQTAITIAETALSSVTQQEYSPDVLMVRGLSHAVLATCLYASDRTTSDGQARLALQAFEDLLRQYPASEEFAEACRYAAWVYGLKGEYAKAITLYETSLQVSPSGRNRVACLVWMANALRCKGSYAEAEERLREALGTVAADRRMLPRICFELAKIQSLTNRSEEAIVTFEQTLAGLEANPFLLSDRRFIAESKWELGYLYYGVKRYREAIAIFREALVDLSETHPDLYCGTLIYLGHCYILIGEHAKARDCFTEVLAFESATDQEKLVAQEWLSSIPPIRPPRPH